MRRAPLLLIVAALALVAGATHPRAGTRWTAEERATLAALRHDPSRPAATDPTNRVADDPRAAALGHRLFFDARLSGTGTVACATCHDPARDFQDGTPLGHGVGTTGRRTMPVPASGNGAWLFWDGRKDSQWSQALGPWESAVEHGGDRTQYAQVIAAHYRAEYEAVFGALPALRGLPAHAGPVADATAAAAWAALDSARRHDVNTVFANMGKAVAAYERRLRWGETRLDRYLRQLELTGTAPRGILDAEEEAGLRLFAGKGRCATCHTGPDLSDHEFHNIGVPARTGAHPDSGRFAGARQVRQDEFNCRSRYSDARTPCDELEFLATGDTLQLGAMKTPSLRNVARRGPYMHAGQFATLAQVVAHYDSAPRAPLGHSELVPLHLTATERRQLVAFLEALTAPLAAPDSLLRAPAR